MTPIEIIALITALFVSIKLTMMMTGQSFRLKKLVPKFWVDSGILIMILAFIVAGVTLFFLLQELTIVQIWATMFFSVVLIVMGLAPYTKSMREVEIKWHSETGAVKMRWFVSIVWIAISIWVLIELFV